MKLTVKTLNAQVPQTIVLDVELDCKISYVKHLIHDQTGIAFANQALFDDGQVLYDSSRLIDCDFIGDRTIHLLLIDEYQSKFLGDKFKVIVKTVTGKTIQQEVRQGERVKDLKMKLQEIEGIPPMKEQRLIFNGKQLNDEQDLFSCDFREGSIIHLIIALYGGPIPMYDLQFRTLAGKTITMHGVNETVQDAIERVWKLEGIRAGDELTFNNEPLDSEKKIDMPHPCYPGCNPDAYKFERDSILKFRRKPRRASDELKIYVKFPGSRTRKAMRLIAKASHSVQSLKSAIESKAGGKVENLKLAGKDRELEDGLKLTDYAVEHEMVVHVTLKLKLFVKRLDNATIFRLEVDSSDRIENVKERIHHQERLPTNMLVLSSGTRRLKDAELVDEVSQSFYNESKRSSPVLGLEVKLVRDLQVCISSHPWLVDNSNYRRPISLTIKSNETIGGIKSRIRNPINCPPDQQHLYFNGEQLVDSCTLDQLRVQNRVGLNFGPRSDAFKISIFPPDPTDQSKIKVQVDAHDTIKYLKSKIEQLSTDWLYGSGNALPSDRQILTYEGRLLEDDRTLLNYGIGADSKLSLSLGVVELEVTVQTEFVERRVLKVRSDCTWEMLVSEIKKLGLSICSENDCPAPWYLKSKDLSRLITTKKPLMITQTANCNKCPGCARIKAFKQVTGWN